MGNRFKHLLSSRQLPPQHRFVESVRVRRVPRQIRIHWRPFVLIVFWVLILVKCLIAHWAIVHWKMPIGSVYVWAPSVGAGFLCTVVFLISHRIGGRE